MYIYKYTMKLLHILYIVILIVKSSEENDIKFYPCKGTEKILETFDESNPSIYNITISTSDVEKFPARFNVKMKFDKAINATMHFDWLSYYDDELSLQFITDLDKSKDLILTIAPRKDTRPGVKSIIINSEEICKELQDTPEEWNQAVGSMSTTTIIYETTTVDIDDKCGKRFMRPHGFITSGYESRPGDWPWHTAVYRADINQLLYICGGTLISNTCVVTAGHCVMEPGGVVLAQRMTTVLGKYNFIGDNLHMQEKQVERIVLHPDFSQFTLYNDISLLILRTEVVYNNFVQPICLQVDKTRSARSIVGTMGYVVGWGITQTGKQPNQLIEARLPIVSKLDCLRNHKAFAKSLDSDTDYCAGFGNGTNVCNGDSGGGMYIERGETWFLQGVVSYGVEKHNERKCDPEYYTLFTDATSYTDFIMENM